MVGEPLPLQIRQEKSIMVHNFARLKKPIDLSHGKKDRSMRSWFTDHAPSTSTRWKVHHSWSGLSARGLQAEFTLSFSACEH